MKRIIAHLDMDAFFAAIEEHEHPRYKGLPLVVGADPMNGRGRGVVSTANYKAREYGIHSALPISRAWKLSEDAKKKGLPSVIFVSPHMPHIKEVSDRIAGIVNSNVPQIERVSVDEMFMDLSFTKSLEKAKKLSEKIKGEIFKKEGLTSSVGIGPNKLIAKLASDYQKPDGLFIVKESEVLDFLFSMAIIKIPGIGPKTEEKFHQIGIKTVGELRQISEDKLIDMFGKLGEDLYLKVWGINNSPVAESGEAKSIGEQETFMQDSLDLNFVSGRLKTMAKGVFQSFKNSDFKSFRTIVLTIRFSDFETKNRSLTLEKPEKNQKILEFESLKMLLPFFDKRENPKKKKIRLIGLRLEKLN